MIWWRTTPNGKAHREFIESRDLKQYCKDHPTEKVVYLHSEGSFNSMEVNGRLRRFLTRGALLEECANLPSSCNVCSSRMSPIPHPHTSGNMWLAKCDYVQKLTNLMTWKKIMKELRYSPNNGNTPRNNACVGKDRFAAEHWIHSHPSVMPCDLSKDKLCVWPYDNIPSYYFEMDLKPAPIGLTWKPMTCRQNFFMTGGKLGVQIKRSHGRIPGALYEEESPESRWGWTTRITKKSEHSRWWVAKYSNHTIPGGRIMAGIDPDTKTKSTKLCEDMHPIKFFGGSINSTADWISLALYLPVVL